MATIFKSIFENKIPSTVNVNFKQVAEVRRAIMLNEGIDVNSINWDLYAKILEAKSKQLIQS